MMATVRRINGTASRRAAKRVPALLGADVEFANFIVGLKGPGKTGRWASRMLLREIPGIPHTSFAVLPSPAPVGGAGAQQPADGRQAAVAGTLPATDRPTAMVGQVQDWGRKYLPTNGGCAYIDLDHLELPIPEVVSAFDYVAAWHAAIRLAHSAAAAANDRLPRGVKLQVLANNSDGFGHSYGSHLNVLVSRRTFDNIFCRRLHYLLYLASYQVSSIIFAGQGKVGAENGAPAVPFQISQRADFVETLTGPQTTHCRPIVNSRDEPLCRPPVGKARRRHGTAASRQRGRLHVIFYDSNLCHEACLLKAGVLQLIVAMLGADRVRPNLLLRDPIAAVVRWSHDPTLRTRAALTSGKRVTAVELQLGFLREAEAFHQRGGFDGVVPRAGAILTLWRRVLEQLRAGDFDALAGSIDWILKLRSLQRVMTRHPELDWQAQQVKHLDHLYSNVDPAVGIYWAHERAGTVHRVVNDDRIEALLHAPPEKTRAWCRALLLRLAGADRIERIDWDEIRCKWTDSHGHTVYRTLAMPDPLGMTKAETAAAFQRGHTLEQVLNHLQHRRAGPCQPREIGTP